MSLKRPDARVIFAGCLPAINKQVVQNSGYEDVLVTPRKLHLLDSVTNASISIDDLKSGCIPFSSDNIGLSFNRSFRFPDSFIQDFIKKVVVFLEAIPYFPIPRWLWQLLYLPDRNTELVRISVGCTNKCSFCSIPKAKGLTKSVPPAIVLEQVQDAVSRGKKHIALSCDELASYGQDLGTDIVFLLDRITALPQKFHLILRNVHPQWIIKYWEGLKPIFRRGKISFIVIPLQSGSDRILQLMKRNHTTQQYRWLIDRIRETSPRTIVRTHLMVGFPGETEEDYKYTYRFVKDLPLDSFHVHCYSEQDFTLSAKLPNKVSAEVAQKRGKLLERLEWINFFRAFRWFPMRP